MTAARAAETSAPVVPEAPAGHIAEQLAAFVVAARFEAIDASTLDLAKAAIVDQLGCQLAGAHLPWTQPALRTFEARGGHAEATVVGRAMRLPAAHAAYVNAVFGHAAELDDYGPGVGAHSGSAVIPAALALCERANLSGRDLLTAVVLGYDIARALGGAASKNLHHRGYHSHAIVSVFSVAAVAGKLGGLDEEQLVHAFAIAGSYASGTMEYDQQGGEVKRTHSGIAVQGGIDAAALAGHGLTGPRTIFEGRRGVLRVLAGMDEPQSLALDLGVGVGMRRCSFKLYPTTATQQSPISLLTRILAEHQLEARDVEWIDVHVDPPLLLHIGGRDAPRDTVQAQFSLPFSLGLRLIHGRNDFELYADPAQRANREVLAAAQRVRMHPNPPEHHGNKYRCEMRLCMRDGAEFAASASEAKGHFLNPLSRDELHEKFSGLAGGVLEEARVHRLLGTVAALERHAASDVADLLTPELAG